MAAVGETQSGRKAASVGNPFRWVIGNFTEERDRWPLWAAVLFGTGIAIYFSLPYEPPAWAGISILAISCIVAVAGRHRSAALLVAVAAAIMAAGFVLADWQTSRFTTPVIDEELRAEAIQGRIVDVEDQGRYQRIVLVDLRVPSLSPEDTPERVRIRTPKKGDALSPGMIVAGLIVLTPPRPPIAPGAFDFQRHAFFQGFGATGYSLGAVSVLSDTAENDGLWLSRYRQSVYARIVAALPEREGTIAAALLTGERGAIPESILAAFRDSGLAHLLAISGLHLGLIAGFVFFSVRALLALWPAVALRYPIKKWAAAAALIAAFLYLLLAGAPIPTQRAFLMIGLVLLAVMVDRIGVSMRLVAWAAIVVLAISPDAILGASFQLSFAAVVALVAVYEAMRSRFALWRSAWMWWQRPLLYFAGVALTTIVANAATLPFAVDHFNRLAVYGLAANMVAVPVTAFWVMPWGLMALLLLPAGLEDWALAPMGWGLTAIIDVAETIAGWDGAVQHVLAPGAIAMMAIVTGGLWLCLWQRRWRLLGLIPLMLGVGATASARPPDILVNAEARMIAVRDDDGRWLFNETRREGFVRDGWLRLVAADDWDGWPESGPSAGGGLSCDSLGCVYRRAGQTVALVLDARAFGEDCHGMDLVVAFVPAPDFCRDAAGEVVDLFDLFDGGAHAVRLDEDGIRIETVGEGRGDRPWVAKR